MKLLLSILIFVFVAQFSFASDNQQIQLTQYQNKLIKTVQSLEELEKSEIQKIAEIQSSKDFKNCITGIEKSCHLSKELLKERSQFFSSQFAVIWGEMLFDMNSLFHNESFRKNVVIKQQISYFIWQYQAHWLKNTQSINDLFNFVLKLVCDSDNLSCLVQGNSDLLIEKHKMMIEMDKNAIESLKNNSGEFVVQMTSI